MAENKKMSAKEVANSKAEKLMDTIAFRASFYRANPHRFVADYLGINLKIFQIILLYMFNFSNYAMYLASRGQGKTFLVALFCCVRCILYPATKICIASSTRMQGNEVLLKIQDELMKISPNLAYEIKECSIGQNNAKITFKNGSWIKVVTASDTGRGSRANILCVDEFIKVDLNVITTVLRKFLTAPRYPKFMDKPEYKDYPQERNKEIYMSSAWMKSHWSFNKLKSYVAQILDETKKYFVCGLPYQLSIKENLLSKEQVEDEMSESDFNQMIWDIEMGCLFFGDTDGAFFSYEDISKQRKLQNAVYPPNSPSDKRFKIPDLVEGERRILSVDVALLASKKYNNDAASIFINSVLPTKDNKYIGNLIFTDNYEGLHTSDLALIVRRLFDQFKCTDIALDVKGVGIGIYDSLCRDISDPLFGTVYPPLSCCNDENYAERCIDKKAPKVIWVINATSQFNNDMYINLREGIRQGYLNFLINEFEAEETLKNIRGYNSMAANEKIKLQMPYIHTTLLVNELINLEHETKGVNIKVYEKSGMRKDRVSSVGYNYWVQCQLERNLKRKKENNFDASKTFNFRPPKLYNR